MRAYGYEDVPDEHLDDEPRLLHLREATLLCNLEDLRRIHAFVSGVLAKAEEPGGTWHEHRLDEEAIRGPDDEPTFIIWFEE